MSNVRMSQLPARHLRYAVAAFVMGWCGTSGLAPVSAAPAADAAAQKVIYFDEKDRFGIKLLEGYVCTHDPEQMFELCEQQRLVPWRNTVAMIQPAHRFWAMFVRRAAPAANGTVQPPSVSSSDNSSSVHRPLSAADQEAVQRKIDATLLPTFQESIDAENGVRRKLGWPTFTVVGFERPVILGDDSGTSTCVIRLRDSGGLDHTMFYDIWRHDHGKPSITTVAIVPASRAAAVEPEYRKLSSAVGYHVDPKLLATLKTEVDAEKKRGPPESAVWPPIVVLVLIGVGIVVFSVINERRKKAPGNP